MISNFSLSDWQAANENISEVDRIFPKILDNHPIREILSPGGCARKEFCLVPLLVVCVGKRALHVDR